MTLFSLGMIVHIFEILLCHFYKAARGRLNVRNVGNFDSPSRPEIAKLDRSENLFARLTNEIEVLSILF